MKIGIIGPKDSVENIGKKLLKVDKSIQCTFYIREEISKMIEVVDQCESEVDGIILTGVGVFNSIKNVRNLKKPNAYIHRNTQSVISTLWKAKEQFENLDRFSIDVITKEVLEETIEELDISSDQINLMPFSSFHKEEDYITWHRKLFDEKKIDFILTGFGAVYSQLRREGYPVFRLMPTYSQVKDSYKKILYKTQISKLKSSQVAVQRIRLSKKTNVNYYEELNIQNTLEKEIISYVRKVQGALYNSGRDEYIISGTRGSFKDSIASFRKLISNVKLEISSGIGYGNTTYEADMNAKNALLASLKDSGLFILDETSVLRGPLNLDKIAPNNKLHKIEKISSDASLSPIYISKIMKLLERKTEPKTDSKELSGYLEISERSARRIINKLIENNYGILETEEVLSKGRPKNIIKVIF